MIHIIRIVAPFEFEMETKRLYLNKFRNKILWRHNTVKFEIKPELRLITAFQQ